MQSHSLTHCTRHISANTRPQSTVRWVALSYNNMLMYVYRNTVTGILLLCFDSSSHVLLIVIFIMAAVETMWYLYTPMVMNSVYGRKGRT